MEGFAVLGKITEIHPIARGIGVWDGALSNSPYGRVQWRKLKTQATIHLHQGPIRPAEVHWDEADGIGRREMKRKLYLD